MIDAEQLRAHAERIRASGVLGRSELMQRLFDFFVESSLVGKTPKEIEIAIDVFGKNSGFEVTQDAMVRVYVHKLRRKLEDYYSDAGRQEDGRFVIPRGEYRLLYEEPTVNPTVPIATDVEMTALDAQTEVLTLDESIDSNNDIAVSVSPPPRVTTSQRWLRWSIPALAALLIANLIVMFWHKGNESYEPRELLAVRDNPLWHDMVADKQPIYIVMGDYYIFGELDPSSEANPESVHRLVRDFNINSRNDLDQLLNQRPELADRYMDLALSYLPISSAYALRDIMPLIEPNRKNPHQVQLIMASDLTPAMIHSSHIIYIGLLSGMGNVLRDIAFAGSQFKIGDTFDELIDRKSGKDYVSQSSVAINDNMRYRDYGYFSSFAGPKGNRIVILAGTRDVALTHTAEAVSHQASLAILDKRVANARDFEALYAVDAIDRMNLDGQLLLADKLKTENIWTGSDVAVVSQTATAKP